MRHTLDMNRRTGRTTAQVKACIDEAAKGGLVYFVVHQKVFVPYVINLIRQELHTREQTYEISKSAGPHCVLFPGGGKLLIVRPERLDTRGDDRERTFVCWDHHAFWTHPGNVVNEAGVRRSMVLTKLEDLI